MKKSLIVDAHAHLGYWPTLKKASDALIYSQEKYKISYTLLSFDGSEYLDTKERGRIIPQINAFKKCYKFVKENEHFGMLLWVRPKTQHALKDYEEVDEFIKNHREVIHGIKYHPYCSRLKITDNRVLPYIDLALKYNLPVLCHTATDKYSKIKYLERLCDLYPNVTFVAAHMELLSNNEECIKAMLRHPNLYCDTAWVNMDSVRKLKNLGLIDRVMFGTDNPIDGFDTLSNPIYEDYYNNLIGLNKKDYEKLMFRNALKVYGINEKELRKF